MIKKILKFLFPMSSNGTLSPLAKDTIARHQKQVKPPRLSFESFKEIVLEELTKFSSQWPQHETSFKASQMVTGMYVYTFIGQFDHAQLKMDYMPEERNGAELNHMRGEFIKNNESLPIRLYAMENSTEELDDRACVFPPEDLVGEEALRFISHQNFEYINREMRDVMKGDEWPKQESVEEILGKKYMGS